MHEIESADRNNFIYPPGELEEALIEIGKVLPDWSMDGTFLADSTIQQYRAELDSVPQFRELKDALLSTLSAEAGGYVVVCLGNVAQALGIEEQFLRMTTALLAEMATPFQPFQRWPLWKTIGTNLAAKPGMSTGIGYNAFHMDLVNATQPPDYTILLCVRPDPLGAGASILSDARAAVSRLSPSTRALLAERDYCYGSFFELSDVGEEYAPFPVLDGEPADVGFVRFTAKMLAESDLREAHAHAARELADELIAGQATFTLQRGDVLIVDQHRWVHGREPLADGQHDVPDENRRVLLQLFLRSRQQL
ncbi:TauD/TfdA family dioxygenase [Streptomyces sp. RPT161]|uniref:TauD/TfdA family dioxygenase n=1 Tax=Streptomyces sp. RPT161 TaxID=3015993 RepID=UPI0022B92BD6|nr:TauD/TfdA family dioxygenase [Streptomyces sp. RPT161]